MAKIDLKDVTLLLKDGGSEQVAIKVGDGTLTYTESQNIEYVLDRGLLDTTRLGDEVPMDVNFDLVWEFLLSSTTATVTPKEALQQKGSASTWVSTSADVCEPYAVDIETTNDPKCADEELEQTTLPDFRWESIDHDYSEGTMSVSGKSNATTANVVRLAQT